MNISKRIAFIGTAALVSAIGFAAPASAQATRTWVSGVGDDVNPCSRTAPCKTFAGAISKTAAGGEINCLDPGGFGAVTITKSMTIACPYTEGGALAGGNGIVLNMPAATDVAFIRGLDIFGVNPPTNGVRFINNGSLHIEDCTIRRFNAANSFGISYQPSGTSRLYVTNTTVADNGSAATGGGILISPTGAAGTARVVLKGVRVVNNANNGVRVDTTAGTFNQGVGVVIEDSNISGNVNGISTNAAAVVMGASVNNSVIANNTGIGIVVSGASSTVRVGNTTITGNATGLSASGGSVIQSWGDNRLVGNPTVGAANDGTFSPPALVKS
jgi:hypothetical protein